MPNYNLTIDSTFQPFSFERYIQPYAIYGEAYNQQENAITELSTKSEEFAALAESERLRNGDNSETYKRYSKYAKDLKEQADYLATKGLNIKTRNAVLDLKRRYSSEIDPIAKMNIKLQGMQDARRKFEMANPTIRYERGYNEVGVDELLKDSNFDYGKSYSGALVEEQVAKASAALAKNMREDPKGWHKILGNQYYQRKIQMGYTPEEVLLAAAGDPKAPKELQKIANDALASSGIESWSGYYDNNGNITDKGKAILNEFRGFVGRGLNNAVGITQYERVSNKAYDYAMQAALRGGGGGGGGGKDKDKTTLGDGKKNPYLNTTVPKSKLEKGDKLKDAFGDEDASVSKNTIKKSVEFNSNPFESRINTIPGSKTSIYKPNLPKYKEEEVNPLVEYNKYKEASRGLLDPNYVVGLSPVTAAGVEAANRWHKNNYEKKHGVEILTDEQAALLRELGYDETSPVNSFYNLDKLVDEYVQVERPVSLNLSHYKPEEDYLKAIIDPNNSTSIIYDYTGESDIKEKGEGIEYDELFRIDDNKTVHINNSIGAIGVDPTNLDYLIIQSGGKNYSILATALYPSMEEVIEAAKTQISNATSQEEVEQTLQELSNLYQLAANGYEPRQSETSSYAGNGRR